MSNEQRMIVLNRLQSQAHTHKCPVCGSGTFCAVEAGKSGNLCWCATKSVKKIIDADSCLCKNCLSIAEGKV